MHAVLRAIRMHECDARTCHAFIRTLKVEFGSSGPSPGSACAICTYRCARHDPAHQGLRQARKQTGHWKPVAQAHLSQMREMQVPTYLLLRPNGSCEAHQERAQGAREPFGPCKHSHMAGWAPRKQQATGPTATRQKGSTSMPPVSQHGPRRKPAGERETLAPVRP